MKSTSYFQIVLLVPMFLILSACEKPDVAGLNKMPGQTEGMSNKMDITNTKIDQTNKNMDVTNSKIDETNQKMVKTNSAIHKQTLLIALTELNKPENQASIFPIPTGLMAAGKAFAEEATAEELVEFTYMTLRDIEEVNPISGLDADMNPLPMTDADKAKVRLQKMAKLYSLMIIAAFTPDPSDQKACEQEMGQSSEKGKCPQDQMSAILEKQVTENGRYSDTVMNFLALRGFFLREVLLKQSLKVDSGSAEILKNSGMMKEALKYLTKLNFISRLPYADLVQVKVQEKQFNLIDFSEAQNIEGKKATAQMWETALAKCQAGIAATQEADNHGGTSLGRNHDLLVKEIELQKEVAATMQANIDFWKAVLP